MLEEYPADVEADIAEGWKVRVVHTRDWTRTDFEYFEVPTLWFFNELSAQQFFVRDPEGTYFVNGRDLPASESQDSNSKAEYVFITLSLRNTGH